MFVRGQVRRFGNKMVRINRRTVGRDAANCRDVTELGRSIERPYRVRRYVRGAVTLMMKIKAIGVNC